MAVGKVLNKEAYRAVPSNLTNRENVIAVKTVCFGSRKCKVCRRVCEDKKPVWFCDGEYMKNGEDAYWHDKCL
jgi:hypothetical protein